MFFASTIGFAVTILAVGLAVVFLAVIFAVVFLARLLFPILLNIQLDPIKYGDFNISKFIECDFSNFQWNPILPNTQWFSSKIR